MFFLAAVTAGLLAGTASSAYAQSRHYSGHGYAPSYGYGSGERTNPTNTNGF
jgi:hypothetical protein